MGKRKQTRSFYVTNEEWAQLKKCLATLRDTPAADESAEPAPAAKPEQQGLTPSQARAMALLEAGQNVFLTGGAGTGKTFLLRQFIAQHEGRVIVAAPSGIAAQRAGGTTLHRAFHLPLQILTDEDCEPDDWLADEQELRKMAKDKRERPWLQALLAADVVVIDEISMCRADVFEYVMKAIKTITEGRKANGKKKQKAVPAHPLQVVLCGDFWQLPPVITRNEREAWDAFYPDNPEGWAFLSPAWQELGFVTAELTEPVRQADAAFSQALNAIRHGDTNGLAYINKHRARQQQADGPTICATNKQAAEANACKYAELRGQEYVFIMEQQGEVQANEISCERQLALKVGCKVLFLTNSIDPDSYKNGSYGTVLGFVKSDKGEVQAQVRLEDTGDVVNVGAYTWAVQRYEVTTHTDKDGREFKRVSLVEVGKYSQLPLRLGWALTAHKSQGQDYPACNITRPGSFWCCGQLYVALSRAEYVDRLYIGRELTDKMVKASEAVQEFFSRCG